MILCRRASAALVSVSTLKEEKSPPVLISVNVDVLGFISFPSFELEENGTSVATIPSEYHYGFEKFLVNFQFHLIFK